MRFSALLFVAATAWTAHAISADDIASGLASLQSNTEHASDVLDTVIYADPKTDNVEQKVMVCHHDGFDNNLIDES